jgi:hypothetical protein
VRNPDQSGHPFRANSDSVPEESGHRSGRIRTPFRSESGQFSSGPGIAC